MRGRDRIIAIGGAIALVLALKLGQQLYRWYAYEPQRVEIGRLEGELESAALGVVGSQVGADTLHRALEAMDEGLREARERIRLYEQDAQDGLSLAMATQYRLALRGYNRQVAARNELFQRWRETIESNRLHVDRYNQLADSIRALAERMGELYYPIPTPAEIAARRGWTGPDG